MLINTNHYSLAQAEQAAEKKLKFIKATNFLKMERDCFHLNRDVVLSLKKHILSKCLC